MFYLLCRDQQHDLPEVSTGGCGLAFEWRQQQLGGPHWCGGKIMEKEFLMSFHLKEGFSWDVCRTYFTENSEGKNESVISSY